MIHPAVLLFASALGLTAPLPQAARGAADDPVRAWLERERKEIAAQVADPAWMADSQRATIVRLAIEERWRRCAESESETLARSSQKPARLLVEAALQSCIDWERTLRLALDKGAYPYLDDSVMTRDEMVNLAMLKSRDAGMERVRLWRSTSPAVREAMPVLPTPAPEPAAPTASILDTPVGPPPGAPGAVAAAPGVKMSDDEATVTIVAQRNGGCRARLADGTLSDAQLAAKAREWVAAGTTVRLVRPAGASYRCLTKIVIDFGRHGLRKFVFVEPSGRAAPAP